MSQPVSLYGATIIIVTRATADDSPNPVHVRIGSIQRGQSDGWGNNLQGIGHTQQAGSKAKE